MLLERDGISYLTPKIAILGGSTTNDIKSQSQPWSFT